MGAMINFAVMWYLVFFPSDWDTSIFILKAEADEIKSRLPEYVFVAAEMFGLHETRSKNRGYTHYYVWGTEVDNNGIKSAVTVYLRCNAGWPMYSFEGASFMTANGMEKSFFSFGPTSWIGTGVAYYLPLKPTWPGFVVNTGLYGGVPWLLICGPSILRRYRRRKRNQCAACGYPRGESDVCTECGRALPIPKTDKALQMS